MPLRASYSIYDEWLTNTTFTADNVATFSFGTRTFLALNDGVAGFSSSRYSLIEITGFKGDLAQLEIADSDLAPSAQTQIQDPTPVSLLPTVENTQTSPSSLQTTPDSSV